MGYPADVMTLSSINRYTKIGTSWANTIKGEVSAVQKDYASCMGTFTQLSTRLTVMRTSQGAWRTSTLTHAGYSLTSGNHHVRQHATSHLTAGGDSIRVATNGGPVGYIGTEYFSKLASVASGATRNRMTAFSFTSLSGYDRIYLGFRARRVILMTQDQSTARVWRWQNHPTTYNSLIEVSDVFGAYRNAHESDERWGYQALHTSNYYIVFREGDLNSVYAGIAWGE